MFKADDDAQGGCDADVEGEARIALVRTMVVHGRLQAVVVVAVGLHAEVGEDAESLREIILGDEAAVQGRGEVLLLDVTILPGMIFPGCACFLLDPVACGLAEAEAVAGTHAGVEHRVEAVAAVVSLEVEQQIDETVHALEVVGIELVPAFPAVAGAAVAAVAEVESQAKGLVEFMSHGKRALQTEQFSPFVGLDIGKTVFVD